MREKKIVPEISKRGTQQETFEALKFNARKSTQPNKQAAHTWNTGKM